MSGRQEFSLLSLSEGLLLAIFLMLTYPWTSNGLSDLESQVIALRILEILVTLGLIVHHRGLSSRDLMFAKVSAGLIIIFMLIEFYHSSRFFLLKNQSSYSLLKILITWLSFLLLAHHVRNKKFGRHSWRVRRCLH